LKDEVIVEEIITDFENLSIINYNCQDCGQLVSAESYPYHNADHSLIKNIYYDKDDVRKLLAEGIKVGKEIGRLEGRKQLAEEIQDMSCHEAPNLCPCCKDLNEELQKEDEQANAK